jgi:hypothetical protein
MRACEQFGHIFTPRLLKAQTKSGSVQTTALMRWPGKYTVLERFDFGMTDANIKTGSSAAPT